jgi:hypothetical protein
VYLARSNVENVQSSVLFRYHQLGNLLGMPHDRHHRVVEGHALKTLPRVGIPQGEGMVVTPTDYLRLALHRVKCNAIDVVAVALQNPKVAVLTGGIRGKDPQVVI